MPDLPTKESNDVTDLNVNKSQDVNPSSAALTDVKENGLNTSTSSTTLDQSTVSITTSLSSSFEDIASLNKLAPICTMSTETLYFE